MNTNKNEVFRFSSFMNNDQILRTYIECVVKYNTLDWFLYYEDYFYEHTNTNLLNLKTNMKTTTIDDKSTDEELDYYFMYIKACHLGIEYIEHSLKLLLMFEGYDNKQIRRTGIEHDLKKHFDLLTDEKLKSIINSSIGHYDEEFLNNVLNGIPSNPTLAESEKKYITTARIANKYFDSILSQLKNGFVDLRYPEISENCNYYNLDIILSICKNLSLAMQTKMEESRILDQKKESLDEYVSHIIADTEEPITTTTDLEINVIDRKLTAFEERKYISVNKIKYKAILYYMYGVEEFYLSGSRDHWAFITDFLQTTSLTRERVNTKSNDRSIYENYLYYQACHLASEYIEHSLKLLLLDSGNTYKDIKDHYSHDFKTMFYALPIDLQDNLKDIVVYFNDTYLDKATIPSSKFRDVIKHSKEELKNIEELWQWADINARLDLGQDVSEEELEFFYKYREKLTDEEQQEYRSQLYDQKLRLKKDKYFDQLLDQNSNAFKMTRYPDFYSFNLDYKYCLKVLLAFAESLRGEIEITKGISYLEKSNFSNWFDEETLNEIYNNLDTDEYEELEIDENNKIL